MADSQSPGDREAADRALRLLAEALQEVLRASTGPQGLEGTRAEIAALRLSLEKFSDRVERQLIDEREQRRMMGEQIVALATSLEHLVQHLQGLSDLMSAAFERLPVSSPAPEDRKAAEPAIREQPFPAGGEGVTIVLTGVPGFQGLMEIQKTLAALDAVQGASIERYQEGESRILLHLETPLTAGEIVEALRNGASLNVALTESKPEVMRLHLKVLPAG